MQKDEFFQLVKEMFPKVSSYQAIRRFANLYGCKPKTVEAWCYGQNPVPLHIVKRLQDQDEHSSSGKVR